MSSKSLQRSAALRQCRGVSVQAKGRDLNNNRQAPPQMFDARRQYGIALWPKRQPLSGPDLRRARPLWALGPPKTKTARVPLCP